MGITLNGIKIPEGYLPQEEEGEKEDFESKPHGKVHKKVHKKDDWDKPEAFGKAEETLREQKEKPDPDPIIETRQSSENF